jgi:hypothetical protein
VIRAFTFANYGVGHQVGISSIRASAGTQKGAPGVDLKHPDATAHAVVPVA